MRIDRLTPPSVTELWSMRQDTSVTWQDGPAAGLVLHTRWADTRIPEPSPGLRETLRRMSLGPVDPLNTVGEQEAEGLLAELAQIEPGLVRTIALGGAPVLSVVPLSRWARLRTAAPATDGSHRLSRFAVLRSVDGRMRIESPLSLHRIELHTAEACAALVDLGLDDRAPDARPADGALRAAVLAHSIAAGMVVVSEPGPGEARFAEDRDLVLGNWSPHELMMHSRTRLGRNDEVFGREPTSEAPPGPAVVTRSGNGHIPLYRPVLAGILRTDPPLTAALEGRRSMRHVRSGVPSLGELGELLFRTARVRALRPPEPTDPVPVERTSRPYPSLGGGYALELYLVTGGCTGLPAGAYHYDPAGHRLEPLTASAEQLTDVLAGAQWTAGLQSPPPLLITFTARISRPAAQFSGPVYASLLKEVGVLQQSLYLVCTAMGLGPCALAAGDADAAAAAFGTDWAAEPSVGEFMVGGWQPADPGPAGEEPANGADWPERSAGMLRGRRPDWDTTSVHRKKFP